jgi:hypothetical protein
MKINSRNFENLLEVCVRDMEPESTFNDASYSKYMESLSNDDTETI